MTEGMRIALALFAVFRVARLIAVDSGPYGVFASLRRVVGARAGKEQTRGKRNGFWRNVADLIHCPYCAGVWLAAVAASPIIYPTFFGDLVLIVLGLAGAQDALQSALARGKE